MSKSIWSPPPKGVTIKGNVPRAYKNKVAEVVSHIDFVLDRAAEEWERKDIDQYNATMGIAVGAAAQLRHFGVEWAWKRECKPKSAQ